MEEFFTFSVSPLYLNDSVLAERAIHLLDKIKEVTGVEYAFTEIQQ
ncbi:MAG TPA: hypothetical protein VJJ79_01015 [Candidatus Nanoarchaeia archaeon]|nr:hypothetical protein [Candidatus Nanoarchaeia archaeon]